MCTSAGKDIYTWLYSYIANFLRKKSRNWLRNPYMLVEWENTLTKMDQKDWDTLAIKLTSGTLPNNGEGNFNSQRLLEEQTFWTTHLVWQIKTHLRNGALKHLALKANGPWDLPRPRQTEKWCLLPPRPPRAQHRESRQKNAHLPGFPWNGFNQIIKWGLSVQLLI